ncbi:MAG: PHP domain-containing protein [Clostridiales bacterium]|nr:PHP domain-containing protein [Clostridiales bacterium]
MRLTGDFHTHTNYTHGQGSVEDSVKQAENLRLDAVAICEHSYKSMYAIKKGDLEKIKEDIDAVKDKYKVKVLWGIEANLISRSGDIDISDEEIEKLDLVVLGYHRFSKVGFVEFCKFVLPNLLKKKPSKKQVERNTMAYINAMDKHRVSILAHLGFGGCVVDYERLAIEAKKRGIYIELNGKRINFGKEDLQKMIATGVQFIINSDAHHPLDVGKNHRAFNLIEKYKIPLSQVANIDKMPEFK